MVGNNTRSVVIRKNDKQKLSKGTLSFDPVGRLLNPSTPSDKLAEKISNSSTTKFKIITKKNKQHKTKKFEGLICCERTSNISAFRFLPGLLRP